LDFGFENIPSGNPGCCRRVPVIAEESLLREKISAAVVIYSKKCTKTHFKLCTLEETHKPDERSKHSMSN
jgi:hypothetical protein